MLCRWGGDAAVCGRYWCSYSPPSPLQGWQSWAVMHSLIPPILKVFLTSTCSFLRQGWEQWMQDLQEIVPGLETKAEERPVTTRQRNYWIKGCYLPLSTGYMSFAGQTSTDLCYMGILALQLSPHCLEEPVWKFRAPGWVSRCSGERVKLGVSHLRNRNPTFSRPLWFFVSLGR